MNIALDSNLPIIRACAHCEQEHDILDRADVRKSHGQCRRHFVYALADAGLSTAEIASVLFGMGPGSFCPDLGE